MTQQNPPERTDSLPPDHIGMLVTGAVMALASWIGIYLLVVNTIPRVGQRWVFFMLLHIGVTGIALPFVRFLNVRLTPTTTELPASGVVVRQSMWVGLYVVTCAWLQIPRALSPSLGVFLALVFVGIEFFLRLRESRQESY
jgi:hypothetical protein